VMTAARVAKGTKTKTIATRITCDENRIAYGGVHLTFRAFDLCAS
jgi:hypothetical protein